MMRSSPLRLKELFFPHVSVKALVPTAPEKAPRELELDNLAISFALDFAQDGKTANAGLKIASKDVGKEAEASALYRVEIEAFGSFDVIGPEHQDDLAVYLRKFAAAAALIGAAREQVALMTARGPWGVVMLPIISMDRVVGLPPKKDTLPTAAAKKIAKGKKSTATPTPETAAAMLEAREVSGARHATAEELFAGLDKTTGRNKVRAPTKKARP